MDAVAPNPYPIGRDQLVAELSALIATARAVTLTGPGGIGKTTVARALIASQLRPERPAVFVDLSGVSRAAAMTIPVAAAVEVAETAETELERALDERLAVRSPLLVLDNLEQIAGAGAWIGARLAASPDLRVVGTSRKTLHVPGEIERPIPPLELPTEATPRALAASPAGALFLERARRIGREYRLDAALSADIVRLLDRLDGIPLAIELAAGRSRVLSPGAMIGRLGSPGVLARDGDEADRHRSLSEVLRWSLEMLRPSQRRLLDALAAWTGPFDLEVAEALAPTGREVLSDLDGLVEAGLVRTIDGLDGAIRFRVLETIRMVVTAGADDRHRVRTARWLAGELDGWAESLSTQTEQGTRRFALAMATIEDLTNRLLESSPEDGHALVVASAPYWIASGILREPEARLRSAAMSRQPAIRLRALIELGLLRDIVDGGGAGIALTDEAIALCRNVDDEPLEMVAAYRRGTSGLNVDDPAAGDWLRHALALAEKHGRTGDALTIRARLADMGQEPESVRAELSRLLAETRAEGGPHLLASLLNDLAANEAMVGLDELSLIHAQESAAISAREGRGLSSAWTSAIAAAAAGRLGRVEVARSLVAEAAAVGLNAGPAFQGFVLSQVLPVLTALQRGGLAARAVGARAAQLAHSGQRISPHEEALFARDVAAARQITNPISWEVEIEAGRRAPLESVTAEVLAATREDRPVERSGRLPALTRREIEVLRLVGRGRSDREIARELFISPKTASVHVANVKSKLEARSRIEVALRARELGLVAGID